jgi:hypothetical protein
MKRTTLNTLLLCVDILEDLTMFLDEEKELHINDIIHICNHHGWELISPMERLYGIYDRENDIHITFSISKNSFVQNYTNNKWCSPFPSETKEGKPFVRRRIKHGHLQ